MESRRRVVTAEELRFWLDCYESDYGLSSEEAMKDGDLMETRDGRDWSTTFHAWLLATKPR